MSKTLCLSCQHFAPALDPNINRAFREDCKSLVFLLFEDGLALAYFLVLRGGRRLSGDPY
jgi:hypothetical protein